MSIMKFCLFCVILRINLCMKTVSMKMQFCDRLKNDAKMDEHANEKRERLLKGLIT